MKIPLLLVLSTTLCGACWAQTNDDIIPPILIPQASQSKRVFKFSLKYVKPSLMAYWLDPANHPQPLSVQPLLPSVPQLPGEEEKSQIPPSPIIPPVVPQTAPPRAQLYLLADKPEIPVPLASVFKLPAGVDRIVAVDPQNALLVFGTPQGAAELAETIGFLDRPLRQVELEARFVRLSTSDAEQLTPSTQSPFGIYRINPADGAFNRTLESLQQGGKATVSKSHDILATNNLETQLSDSSATPVSIKNAQRQDRAQRLPEGLSLSLETQSQLKVTPTINNDDTITLLNHLEESLRLGTADQPKSDNVLVLKNDLLQAIVNVRDGETVALRSLQRENSPRTSQTTIVLLTARIIKSTTQQ